MDMQITDYGLRLFRATKNKLTENYPGMHLECFPRTFHYRKLWKPTYNTSKFPFYINITGDLWTAPEILRMRDAESSTILQGTSLTDIYSFGVIIQEIVTREGPYAAQLCYLDAQGKTRMLNLQEITMLKFSKDTQLGIPRVCSNQKILYKTTGFDQASDHTKEHVCACTVNEQ